AVAAAAAAVQAELTQNNVNVLASRAAALRFEERASSAPATLSQSDLDALPSRSQSAIRNLALGRYAAAREDLTAALKIADKGLEELSREEARARGVVDACLFMVRTYLEGGNRGLAREQAMHCRRMFPDTEPTSQQLHTPEVRELVTEVDQELANGPHGTLAVESTPSGCVVRLNGKRMGTTPARIEDLAAHDYRIQVECEPEGDTRGRVYTVALKKGVTNLVVDVPFDRAVSTTGDLALAYPNDGARDEYRLAHAIKAAKVLGADEVWLLSAELETGHVRVDRVLARTQAVLASASFEPLDAGGVPRARDTEVTVNALRAGSSVTVRNGQATAEATPWRAPVPASAASAEAKPAAEGTGTASRSMHVLSTGWRIVGIGLVVAGAASLVGAAIPGGGHAGDGEGLEKSAATPAGKHAPPPDLRPGG
ncbi:MAG: PEGA domain-containing protein, partial [Myxococcales bacterium]|nr:PEGA domain-containing protein [Myxococcales bacterium]